MSDVLIRNVPESVLASIDARAASLSLSRNEYLRRRLSQEALRDASPVSVEDLARFGEAFSDLGDSQVMTRAWE